jgi:hypothetical protein
VFTSNNSLTLEYWQSFQEEIPSKPGNYFWVYSPWRKKSDDFDILVARINKFSNVVLSFEEIFKSQKTLIKVNEISFNDYKNSSFLGLGDNAKACLIDFLETSVENRAYFCSFMHDLAFLRPFYIGKADDLQRRIKQHMRGDGSSPIMKKIRSSQISFDEIYIGYDEIAVFQNNKEVLNVFEELTQRLLRPQLTKKFGK